MSETSDDRDERRLPPSERKLAKAREDGDIPRSREAGHAAALIAALLTVAAWGPGVAEGTLAVVRQGLRFDRELTREPGRALEFAAALTADALWVAMPLLVAPVAAAVLATLVVGGLVFTLKPVTPQLSRLDPVAGLGRIFSKQSLIEMGKLAVIAFSVGTVGAWFAASGLERFVAYSGMPLPAALASAGGDLRTGLLWVAGVVIAVAALDGPLQIWRHRQKLMMTPQEMKQEAKESEGSPEVKGRQRQIQREISRGRMLAAVPTADVVITNPTHYAVALEYVDGEMNAPRVVAKGADLLAARIREIAAESGVPLLEAPPLARALYRHVQVDQEIPAALYSAVAQVLAWVHQLQQHAAGRGARPSEPGIVVPPGLDPMEGRV
jgi:flagellar biosynthetic protein FlhB